MPAEPTPEALRARYAQRLADEIAALATASAETRASRLPVALDQQSVGRLSRMDALQGQAMAAAQEGRRQAQMVALRAAEQRLAGEDFGYCQRCGEFIGLVRLDHDPALQLCFACASAPRRR